MYMEQDMNINEDQKMFAELFNNDYYDCIYNDDEDNEIDSSEDCDIVFE